MQNVEHHDFGQVKTASGLNVLAGIWLIIAPFLLGFTNNTFAMWDGIIVGVIVLILAAIRFASPDRNGWLSWVNLILGLWLIVAPFVLGFSFLTIALWDSVVIGIAVAILAFWSAMTFRRMILHH